MIDAVIQPAVPPPTMTMTMLRTGGGSGACDGRAMLHVRRRDRQAVLIAAKLASVYMVLHE